MLIVVCFARSRSSSGGCGCVQRVGWWDRFGGKVLQQGRFTHGKPCSISSNDTAAQRAPPLRSCCSLFTVVMKMACLLRDHEDIFLAKPEIPGRPFRVIKKLRGPQTHIKWKGKNNPIPHPLQPTLTFILVFQLYFSLCCLGMRATRSCAHALERPFARWRLRLGTPTMSLPSVPIPMPPPIHLCLHSADEMRASGVDFICFCSALRDLSTRALAAACARDRQLHGEGEACTDR